MPPTGIDRRAEEHLGLRLLKDAVAEMGGRLEAANVATGGTSVVVELPRDGVTRFLTRTTAPGRTGGASRALHLRQVLRPTSLTPVLGVSDHLS